MSETETTDDYDSLTEFRAQFDWSPDLSPKMVADSHKGQFPVISVVTSGYDGCDGMHEFALDEVYCIVSILKQKRVVVTDMNRRYISIPLDYHAKFHSLTTDGKIKGPVKSLSQIIDSEGRGGGSVRLMFEDNRAVKFNECASTGSRDKLGYLEYDESYNEKYLVCHPLQNSEILAEVVLIPIYVPISLAIVRGFSSMIVGDFGDWMTTIRSSVKAFDTTNIKPCMDVVIFDDSPASDYVTIMPVSLFQHLKNSNDTEEASPSPKESVTYDNITQCQERTKKTKKKQGQGQGQEDGGPCPPPPPPLRSNRRSVLIDIPERSNAFTKTSPRLPPKSNARSPAANFPPPPSPNEGRKAPKTPQQQQQQQQQQQAPEVTRETKPPPLPPPRGSDSGAGVPPGRSKSPSGQRSKVVESSPVLKEHSQSPRDVFRELPPLPPLLPPPPSSSSSVTLGEGGRPSKVSPTGNATRFVKGVALDRHHQPQMAAPTAEPPSPSPPPPPSPPQTLSKSLKKVSMAEESVIKQFQSLIAGPQPPAVTREFLKEKKPSAGPGSGAGEKQEKKALLLKEKKDEDEEDTPYEDVGGGGGQASGKRRRWKRAAEIPLDLDIGSLTVAELCHCLSLLKMEKYSRMFLDQMVDGALLVEMSDEMLSKEFGFSVFEVKKLMNFAKNKWRPKTE